MILSTSAWYFGFCSSARFGIFSICADCAANTNPCSPHQSSNRSTSAMFHCSITVLMVMRRGLPSCSFASSRFSSTFGSAAGFESGFVGSAASASRLTTSPVTARRMRGFRSSSVPLGISNSERYLHSNPPQQPDRRGRRQLFAEDVRLFLRAVTAGQVALVRDVKRDRIRRHHLCPQNLPPPRVSKIKLKILRHKRRMPYQTPQ